MKKMFYAAIAALIVSGCGGSAVSNGDKVNLDKFSFTASYRDLPRQGLDTSYHTYAVSVDYGFITRLAMKRNEMEDQVVMEGWRKLPHNAHVQVKVKFDDLIIQGSEVKERVEVLKDKNGKETGKRTTYVVEVAYSFGANAKVTDYRGAFIDNLVLASRDARRVHQSDVFTNSAEAKAYSKFGLILLTSQLTRQSMTNALSTLSNNLTYNYGYPERYVNDFFWVVNSRKHPEYENHQRAWGDFKRAVTYMSPNEPLDEVREMMQPVINYYNKAIKMYSSDSKGDKKMRYASHYNLAKIYWYLDDPDAAMREATELVINGYDAKDGRGLEAAAIDLKMLMRQSRINSRHFRIDIQDYAGPSMTSGTE